MDLEFGHDDNLWFLKTKIIDIEHDSIGTDFRLFYENEEIEVDETLPISQVFDVEKPIEIKALLPKAAQILVRNQKANCKLLVGKGENMKIFEPRTGSAAEPVTLEPIGSVSNIIFPTRYWFEFVYIRTSFLFSVTIIAAMMT